MSTVVEAGRGRRADLRTYRNRSLAEDRSFQFDFVAASAAIGSMKPPDRFCR